MKVEALWKGEEGGLVGWLERNEELKKWEWELGLAEGLDFLHVRAAHMERGRMIGFDHAVGLLDRNAGEMWFGVACVNPMDVYRKKRGMGIALARALKDRGVNKPVKVSPEEGKSLHAEAQRELMVELADRAERRAERARKAKAAWDRMMGRG